MAKQNIRTYSHYTIEALALIGNMIKVARKERKLTMKDLSERTNISVGAIRRIEKGEPGCQLGAAFEVATVVGVKLFDDASSSISTNNQRIEDKLALLPSSVRKKQTMELDDDF